MGWFDDDNWLNPGLALGPVGSLAWDQLDLGGKHADQARNQYLQEQLARQAQQKQNQLALLGQRRAPTMAPEMESRLKALEQESQPGALVADPEFQGLRSKLVGGGRQALASVQNKQAAAGVQGGFANTGSMQNVYDRMGAQLAQLGQQQIERKNQKADHVAQARQAFSDAQTEYQNGIIQAKMAIESGDAAALNDAYARIQASQAQADQARKAMFMGVATTGVSVLAGNPLGAAQGAQQTAGGASQQVAAYPSTVGQASGMYGAPQAYQPAYSIMGYGRSR